MASESANLARLKQAYKLWHDAKAQDTSAWLALMADEIHISSVASDAPGVAFAKPRRSRSEAVEYLAAITHEWRMVHWTPDVYVGDGETIAMFGSCAWTHKKTGKIAEVRVAHLWRFKGDKAVEFSEVFDSARVVAAATA